MYESKRLRLCTTLALCLSLLSHHTDYYSVPVRQMTPNSQSTNCYIIYTLSSYIVTPYVRLAAYHHMYVLLTVDSLLN